MILVFRREADESSAFLGYYAGSSGQFLTEGLGRTIDFILTPENDL
jgi:hypothetical protein